MRATISHPYELTKYRDGNWPFAKPWMQRERERDQCFMALTSLQQWKHFIVIRALLDLASGGSADSNETHTYHYGQNAKLSRTKLF